MAKTAMIRARVEPELKQEAEKVFAKLGLTATEAIRLFYRQTALHNGLPFELRIPNEETLGGCPSGAFRNRAQHLLQCRGDAR